MASEKTMAVRELERDLERRASGKWLAWYGSNYQNREKRRAAAAQSMTRAERKEGRELRRLTLKEKTMRKKTKKRGKAC